MVKRETAIVLPKRLLTLPTGLNGLYCFHSINDPVVRFTFRFGLFTVYCVFIETKERCRVEISAQMYFSTLEKGSINLLVKLPSHVAPSGVLCAR